MRRPARRAPSRVEEHGQAGACVEVDSPLDPVAWIGGLGLEPHQRGQLGQLFGVPADGKWWTGVGGKGGGWCVTGTHRLSARSSPSTLETSLTSL